MKTSVVAIGPVLTALMLALALPPAVLAAQRPTTIAVVMGANCVGGLASDNETLDVSWRNAGGRSKAHAQLQAGPTGRWEICTTVDRHLAVGDVIDVTADSSTHHLQVPDVTLQIDRVADRYFGRAPAGDVVTLRFDRDLWEARRGRRDKVGKPDGTWSYQATHDVVGGLWASLLWTSPGSDTVLIETRAPYIALQIGDSRFEGIATPKSTFTARLYDDTAKIGRRTVTVSPVTSFYGRFRDTSGNAVPVSVGNWFEAPLLATDAGFLVPEIDGDASVDSDVVGLTCHDAGTSARTFSIRVTGVGGETRIETHGSTEENGSMALRFLGGIEPGDMVLIGCMQISGDWVHRAVLAH